MTEDGDLELLEEMDPFGREVGPLEALRQDIVHWIRTVPGTVAFAPDWGFGLENYLGRPLPSGLATDMTKKLLAWDRISDARVTIDPLGSDGEGYRVSIYAVCAAGFLNLVLAASSERGVEVLS